MRSALVLATLLAGPAAAVLAGVTGRAGPAASKQPFDLVLDGERALVALFPPLAELVDSLVHLATFTCEAVPLVPLLAERVSVPPLAFLEYSAAGARPRSAAQAAADPADTALYVGGWGNHPRDAAARALVAALLPTHRRVLALDTRAFRRGYVGAAARVPALARRLALWLRGAVAAGARLDRWHVVGFSLGAHVAARALLAAAAEGRRAGRLTALEPARPCGTAAVAAGGWRRGARLVTVVHASRALALGAALGHADVWVSAGATALRGCGAGCQHAAAWRLWAASARDDSVLAGARCADAAALAAGRCAGRVAALGARADPRARGLFLYNVPANVSLLDMAPPLFPDTV